MRVDGQWNLCDDGVIRPVFAGEILLNDGTWLRVPFLGDTGADRTVISADVYRRLDAIPRPTAERLIGIGGDAASVVISARIRMTRETGESIYFTGEFAAFTDDATTDMSVMGRDITNLFALITDRPKNVVCLLGSGHDYVIRPS